MGVMLSVISRKKCHGPRVSKYVLLWVLQLGYCGRCDTLMDDELAFSEIDTLKSVCKSAPVD